MRFSLVIPFHNTPIPYFDGCLESLRRQSLLECEFVLVDDWSTDPDTINLAKSYLEKDGRFRYVRDREWGHEGGAREFGYQQAKGEYVWFFDSDDRLANPSVLSELWGMIVKYNQPDVALCEETHIKLDDKWVSSQKDPLHIEYFSQHAEILEAYQNHDKRVTGNFSPHNKIFKRKFLQEIDFSCAKRTINADIIFVIVMPLAHTMIWLDVVYYLVVDTPNSLTKQTVNNTRYQEIFQLVRHTHQFYLEHQEAYQPIIGYITGWVMGLISYNRNLILSWSMNNRENQKKIELEYYDLLKEILPHYPRTLSGTPQMIDIKQSIYENRELTHKEIHHKLYRYFLLESGKIRVITIVKKVLPKSLYNRIKTMIKKR